MKTGKYTHDNYYLACHHKMIVDHGKAVKCENIACESKNPKRFEWALIKGKSVSSNIEDHIQLCPSCHRKYDITDSTRIKMSDSRKGISPTNKHKTTYSNNIKQFNKKGVLINEWNSLGEIMDILKISKGNISSCIMGNRKTAGGFIWQI